MRGRSHAGAERLEQHDDAVRRRAGPGAERRRSARSTGSATAIYKQLDGVYIRSIDKGEDEANAQQQRSADSADLPRRAHGRGARRWSSRARSGHALDGAPAMMAASMFGNVLPAMWSFMLAARARGLGTCWTTIHLMMEQQAADVLGIPFDTVQQVCLTPLAYTIGHRLQAGRAAAEPDTIIHWDRW